MSLSHVVVKCPNCGKLVAPLMIPIGAEVIKICPRCRVPFNKKQAGQYIKPDKMTKGRWIR